MPTIVHLPQSGEPEMPSNTFKVGDRVQLKDEFRPPKADIGYWQGTVLTVPKADRPLLQLGPHKLGNEVSVKSDLGTGTFIADADRLEKI